MNTIDQTGDREEPTYPGSWWPKPVAGSRAIIGILETPANDDAPAPFGADNCFLRSELVIDGVQVPRSLDPRQRGESVDLNRQTREGLPFLARVLVVMAIGAAVLHIVMVKTSTTFPFILGGSVVQPRLLLPTSTAPDSITATVIQSASRRLEIVEPGHAIDRGEPYPLVASVAGAAADATVLVSGLPSQARFSVGRPALPDGWLIPVSELGNATIIPPRNFVGPMQLTLDLRLADGTNADRKTLRLDWSGKPTWSAARAFRRHLTSDDVAILLGRAQQLLANGELAAARLAFAGAAEAGDPQAAFALAQTYEPAVLERVGAKGVSPDPAVARSWYEKARAMGSTEAQRHLDGLIDRYR